MQWIFLVDIQYSPFIGQYLIGNILSIVEFAQHGLCLCRKISLIKHRPGVAIVLSMCLAGSEVDQLEGTEH